MPDHVMRIYTTDFTHGNVQRQLLTFSAPLFMSNFLQVVYNIADMVIVGNVVGKTGISAVAVGGDITHFLTFLVMGFASAGQVIIAQFMGAGHTEKLNRFISTMFAFLLGSSALLSIICFFFRTQLLSLMNTPPESFSEALKYTACSIPGLVFVYGYNTSSAVMRGLGDSRHPFIFISMAAVLNILLDLLFVVKFRMGAMGAALATVISQGLSFSASFTFIMRRKEAFGLSLRMKDFFHIDYDMLLPLLKLGLPMAIRSASIQFSKVFMNSWVNSYGVAVSAVGGIANKLNAVGILFANAITTSGASMAGQNIGSRKFDRVPKIMFAAGKITVSISALLSAIVLISPRQVFGMFTQDPEVMSVAMQYLPIAVIFFFGAAFRAPMNTLINGSGNYYINLINALLDAVVMRIGLSLMLGLCFKMGYMGFWLGDSVAGFTPFVIGLAFYFSGKWRTNKYIIGEK
ncbi:MAG: MATE family efflux transporter [Elusimicrobiales bacterium]|nr:MATE family efflux transporter [Elusimicrobiales bacterium]